MSERLVGVVSSNDFKRRAREIWRDYSAVVDVAFLTELFVFANKRQPNEAELAALERAAKRSSTLPSLARHDLLELTGALYGVIHLLMEMERQS